MRRFLPVDKRPRAITKRRAWTYNSPETGQQAATVDFPKLLCDPRSDLIDRSPTNLISAIGPQRPNESPLARRVRFHQSWYRAVVLQREAFGRTVGADPRPLGSILTDVDAQAWLNFTSASARRLFVSRHEEGWGIDPVRSMKYLTSSQTLMINVFGLLAESKTWSARVFRAVLDRTDITAINWIKIEYAPRRRSEYLHDSTRLDVLVSVRTNDSEELLAVEIKYSDRFNSRRVNIDRAPYRRLATAKPIWRDIDGVLQATEVNQLVRCHALAAALSDDLAGCHAPVPTLLVLHHAADMNAATTIARYRTHLCQTMLTQGITHRAFISALYTEAKSPAQRQAARTLQLRYIDENESELAWRLYSNSD